LAQFVDFVGDMLGSRGHNHRTKDSKIIQIKVLFISRNINMHSRLK